MPSPGMTAIRYVFLLILRFPWVTGRLPGTRLIAFPCNGPNCILVQRCSAMLTADVPTAYQFRRTFPSDTPHEARIPMDLHLRGKRVLITGASKGIGAAAAEAFAEEGCDVMLAARSGEQLKALAERLRSAHQVDATAHVV